MKIQTKESPAPQIPSDRKFSWKREGIMVYTSNYSINFTNLTNHYLYRYSKTSSEIQFPKNTNQSQRNSSSPISLQNSVLKYGYFHLVLNDKSKTILIIILHYVNLQQNPHHYTNVKLKLT